MSDCALSPTAHAFSTVLTAFIGSIVNGFSNGALIAFITGWIAWLAWLRILTAAIYEYYLSYKAGTKLEAEATYESIPLTNIGTQEPPKAGPFSLILVKEVSVLGWIGWLWSALYTPISTTIWLVINSGSPDGGIKLARAIAIGVSALGLTFDNKQRYAASIGRKWGSWAFVAFNIWNASMCLLLGIECAILLAEGAIQLQVQWFVILIYCIFSCVWAGMSYKILPVVDGTRKKSNFFINVLVGAFAGIFVAAPAIVLWQTAQFDADVAKMRGGTEKGLSLGDYLSCESASVAQKFAAIMP